MGEVIVRGLAAHRHPSVALVACPTCGSAKFFPCRTRGGLVAKTHNARKHAGLAQALAREKAEVS